MTTSAPLTFLVAGITGQLGAGLVEHAAGRRVRLVPVVRRIGRLTAPERVARAFPDAPDLARLTVEGDVSLPGWGMAASERERLAGEIDVVLNLAADTNWASTRRRLLATNVAGAVHGLEVAESLAEGGACRLYAYASTIFAAGDATGTIRESLVDVDADRTLYEHSKWRAEHELARRASESTVAVAIGRIAALIGSTDGGRTVRQNSIYTLPKLWERLPGHRLPLSRRGRIDILPRDVAAGTLVEAVERLAADGPAPLDIFHVCGGSDAPTMEAFVAALRSLDVHHRFAHLRPLWVPDRLLRGAIRVLDEILDVPGIWRAGLTGTRYLSFPRVFERDRLAALVADVPKIPLDDVVRMSFGLHEAHTSPRTPGALARFAG